MDGRLPPRVLATIRHPVTSLTFTVLTIRAPPTMGMPGQRAHDTTTEVTLTQANGVPDWPSVTTQQTRNGTMRAAGIERVNRRFAVSPPLSAKSLVNSGGVMEQAQLTGEHRMSTPLATTLPDDGRFQDRSNAARPRWMLGVWRNSQTVKTGGWESDGLFRQPTRNFDVPSLAEKPTEGQVRGVVVLEEGLHQVG